MTGHEGDNRLDRSAVRRAFSRAAAAYDGDAGLQRDIGNELLERLEPVRIEPRRIVDLGCGTGHATRALATRYAAADVIAVDFAEAMLARLPRSSRLAAWLQRARGPRPVCADIRRLPLADASVDLLFSNLAFQWIGDVSALFVELRRVLRPGGVLMFSTFGPDTLAELRAAWAAVDGAGHVHGFADMHDIGDAMLAAGLRDPVMDVDRVQKAYADLPDLMRRIKAIGAQNALTGRRRGLTGRARLAELERAYPLVDAAGRPLASWEVVYGHAWGADTPRPAVGDAREFRVPVESVGRNRSGAAGGRGVRS